MAREEEGLRDDDGDQELEPPTPRPAPRQHDSCPFVQPTQPLSRAAKNKLKKRAHDRAKRRAAVEAAQANPVAPPPAPYILKKAAESSTVEVNFSASDFRASKPRWTGTKKPLEHPLLEHARDPEYLKKHMQYADWQGK